MGDHHGLRRSAEICLDKDGRKLENWSWSALPASDGVLFQHHSPFQCRYFDMCGAASPHVVSAYWCSWSACCLLWLWCWLKNKEGNFSGYSTRQPSESLVRKFEIYLVRKGLRLLGLQGYKQVSWTKCDQSGY